MTHERTVVVLRWLGWWATSMLLWLALVSNLNGSDAIVGAGVSAIAATMAEFIRQAEHGSFAASPRMLRHALRLPLLITRDTFTVYAALYRAVVRRRPLTGKWSVIEVAQPEPQDRSGGRQLLATLGISVTPNAFVADFDERSDAAMIHQLVPDGSASLEELIHR